MDEIVMNSKTKKILPQSGNYLVEGARLGVINFVILVVVACISIGIFWLVYRLRLLGILLPLPVWLILLGTGIPCFMFWFQYGKVFGSFVRQRRFTKGLTLGVLGNIPGAIALYILIYNYSMQINLEIYRIVFIIYLMFSVVMPIMVVLGTLDRQYKGRP